MNNQEILSKKAYHQPEIACIELDNEISLALQSAPPEGPGETYNQQDASSQNPYKNTLA